MSCPLLLRLREVRMPNVAFHTFPSFSGVSRYEHSLGVAHLAYRWATRQQLDKHIAEALAIAALYHDSATPAFSHLYEEFLSGSGFDHEKALIDLILGTTELSGGEYSQVFLGGHCLLRDVLPYSTRNGLSVTLVASILSGEHPLSAAISGTIDLDNIDNVVRAVTAMGLEHSGRLVHPYAMADALQFFGGRVSITSAGTYAVAEWSRLRRLLYSAILGSETEFRTQAAVRWAISVRAIDEPDLLYPTAWIHTEPALIFEHLRQSALSRYLIDRVRLAGPPPLLFSAWCEDLAPILGPDGALRIANAVEAFEALTGGRVHLNYYVDKRSRAINAVPDGQLSIFEPGDTSHVTAATPGLVGGVYLTDSAYRPPAERRPRLFSHPTPDEVKHILRVTLGLECPTVSASWIGSKAHA